MRRFVCLWAATTTILQGCGAPAQVVQVPKPAPVVVKAAMPNTRPEAPMLGSDAPPAIEITPTTHPANQLAGVTVEDLPPTETAALLARGQALPQITGPAPVMRPATPMPAVLGTVQPIAFVRPTGNAITDKPIGRQGAIVPSMVAPQILPVGEVRMESTIRVRFQDAMIPLDKLDQHHEQVATISPPITGTWKWLDTRVAEFTAKEPRLAQATEYTVTVPAGTKSLDGAVLDVPVTGTFMTSPPALRGLYPYGIRNDGAIGLVFDQRIDPKQILGKLHITDAKKHPVEFTLTSIDDARRRWELNPMFKYEPDKLGTNYVLLSPKGAWPKNQRLRVMLDKGAASLEGPRVSTEISTEDAQIWDTFYAQGIDCDYQESRKFSTTCPESSLAMVQFSNPIGPMHPEFVQIAGQPLKDASASYTHVYIKVPPGVGKQNTVKLSSELVDQWGQHLTGPDELKLIASPFEWDTVLIAEDGFYVLDPRFKAPQWDVIAQSTKNLHVELYKVQPSDYFAYQDFQAKKRATPPGVRVLSKDFPVGKDYYGIANVDLSPALTGGTGQVLAIATAEAAGRVHRYSGFEPKKLAWIQVTKLAVTSRMDGQHIQAWVDDITPTSQFLSPHANVQTQLVVENSGATPNVATDATGHAMIELPPAPPKPALPNVMPPSHRAVLVAKEGNDSVFAWIDTSERAEIHRNALWYVTDDRFTYKPGEPLYVKGWVRWTHDGINPGLEPPKVGDKIAYALMDARGNKLADGTTQLGDQGGFDLTLQIPANAGLGRAQLDLSIGKDQGTTHTLEIEEFRTPAYAVNLDDDVQFSGTKPLFLGDTISMQADAHYYGGGGLEGAQVAWSAELVHATYRPPNWPLFSFEPMARRGESRYRAWARGLANQSTNLGAGSISNADLKIEAVPEHQPAVLSVDTVVTDVDRQTIRASSRKILVHPADRYIGMKMQSDSMDTLEVIVTDVDGNAIAGVPVTVKMVATMASESYKDDAIIRDEQTCNVTSAITPVTCKVVYKDQQYRYRAEAELHDARGRINTAQFMIPWWHWPDPKETLSVTADKDLYRVGETAKLTITSKVLPAQAVVSLARNGVIKQTRLSLTEERTQFPVPIEQGYMENLFVEIDRSAKLENQDKHPQPLPNHDMTGVELKIDLESSRLDIDAKPSQPIVEPGADASFDVLVTKDKKPVANAEVALIVVDEAVLALSGEHHGDPLLPFYSEIEEGTTQQSTIELVRDEDDNLDNLIGFTRELIGTHGGFGSGQGTGAGYGTMGHGMGGGGVASGGPISARQDFRATAIFAPLLHTDERGHVTAHVKMPESLTRFRIVALATAKTYWFGKGENSIITQRKVNVRTQAPRFATQGDAFEVPVIVQNLDTKPRTISVAMRAANLTGGGGKRVTVPGGQRAEVRLPFATMARGKATIQTVMSSGEAADSTNVTIPVYEPATTETFATYGIVDDKPAREQLKVPGDVFVDVGGIETEVASTQMQNLTDAFGYLQAYPYECAEQRSSRMLATTAMADVLDAFAAPGRPSVQELKDIRAADIQKLVADQNKDGGWGYWRDTESVPFVTMQVVQAIGKSSATPAARKYIDKQLADAMKRLATDNKQQPYDVSLAAYALTSLQAMGVDQKAPARKLFALAKEQPVDAKAMMLAIVAKDPGSAAMRKQLVGELLSRIHETANGAEVTTQYTQAERLLLVSDHRSTALVMNALIKETPAEPLIGKLARGLMAARVHGRWRSTQENLAVLQAMRRYFDAYEKETPNFTGKLWIGNAAYAEQAFAGRSDKRARAQLTWEQVPPGSTNDIAIAKDGPGRMYYRVGITYAPKQRDLPALDAGFIVRRSYQALDNPTDVEMTPHGTKIKLGARVLVVLEAVTTMDRDNVALVDPMPAGFEIVNTALKTSERASDRNDASHWNHIEARDNRSEAFAFTLHSGTHRFAYTVRATTPGTFLAAPAKAEEMYTPETFGRSAGTTVVIQ
ncbi:MAG: alpha-2-macroglobulin family protein [Kofleriaceae bacterium]